MRRLIAALLPLLIVALALVAIGCNCGGAEPTPTPTPTPTAAPTPTPAPTPSPTPVATPTPARTPTPTGQASDLPCRFWGSVQLDDANVADGTVITAVIGGDEYTTTTPVEEYGASSYGLKIQASYAPGTAVTFMVGDYAAAQTASWVTGGNINVDLTASTS